MDDWELELRPVRRGGDLEPDPTGVSAEPTALRQLTDAITNLQHAIERIGFRLESIEDVLGLRAPLEDRPLADAATRAMRRFQTRTEDREGS